MLCLRDPRVRAQLGHALLMRLYLEKVFISIFVSVSGFIRHVISLFEGENQVSRLLSSTPICFLQKEKKKESKLGDYGMPATV
jgi:hypothetical protein